MTNIKKRSFAIIMAILVGVMFTVPSLTIEHVNALSKTGTGKFVTAGKGKSGGAYTSSKVWGNTGELTYYNIGDTTCLCLDKTSAFGSGSTYQKKSVDSIKYKGNQKHWLKPVLMFSYGSDTAPPYGNKADKFAASQMIIWQLGAKEIGSGTEKLGKHKSGQYYNVLKGHSYGLKNYDWIIDRVNEWMKGPSFKGKTYDMGEKTVYSVTDTNSFQKYTIDSKKGLDSVKITKNAKGKYVYTVTKNNNGKGTLTLVDSKTKKTGAWYVYKCGSYQTVSATAPADSKEYKVNFLRHYEPQPSLIIQKTDASTGETVQKSGFKFQIKKKSDGALWKDDEGNTTFPTNTRGIVRIDPFTACAAGEWQIVEVGVPTAGEDDIQYELNSKPVDIPAIAANQDGEMAVKFANYPAPDISTEAYDKDTTTHLGSIGEKCTIVDKVTCESLIKGKQYTINGVLVDKESGKDIENAKANVTFTMPNASGKITDKDGNEIGEATFKDGEASEAIVYMSYTFDSRTYAGKDVVVAETLVPKDGKPVVHRDLNDTEQTIHFPSIGTRAFDLLTNSNVGTVSNKQTIKDIVSFKNLIAGKEYTAIGRIIDKETGDVLAEKEALFNVNEDGTSDVDKQEAAKVNFTIKYNANGVYDEDGKLIEDKKGTGEDKTQEINAEEEKQKEEAEDQEVSSLYKFEETGFTAPEGYAFDSWNTKPDGSGKSYSPERSVSSIEAEEGSTVTLYAQYIEGSEDEEEPGEEQGGNDENDPDADSQDEEEIPNPDQTPQKFVSGEFEMTFDDFDSSKLQGKKIVVFEVVKYNDTEIAKHEEIDSEEQTITYPSVHTNALDKTTAEHVPALGEKQTIVDTVSYTGLTPGEKYTLKGKLMNKKTGEPFLIDGKEVTKEMEFTPEESDGEVQLEFDVDTTMLAGETIVVFEDVFYKDNPLVAHANIEDEDQSIHIPKIGTKAADVKTKDEVGTAIEKTKLSDKVMYENLIAGKEYTVTGVLMDKETNKPVTDKEGKPITAKTVFTPQADEKADSAAVSGSVDVVFEFDSELVKGKTTVVFEDLYLGENKVATHSDINDKDQTTYYNDLKTTATLNGKHVFENKWGARTVAIKDKVEYKNLVVGKKYTVKGVLMDKSTGKPITQNGKKVTSSKTFTAKESNGSVTLTFRVNPSKLGNKTTVVFEDLYHNDVKVGTHSDLKDTAQTVKIKTPPTPSPSNPSAQTGDNVKWWILGIIAGLALIAGGAVIYKKRK